MLTPNDLEQLEQLVERVLRRVLAEHQSQSLRRQARRRPVPDAAAHERARRALARAGVYPANHGSKE